MAPPDPVAALAVGRKAGLPPRLITLIQGEGLLNDATALTILAVAVSAARGDGFSTPAALGQFLLASVGGVAAGVAVAYGVRPLRQLRGDPLSSNAISLATPFVAYLLGESLHVSGVLAVVVAGLIIGHNNPSWASGASRLQTGAVWRLVDFLLEGFVFLLIGQQLPTVIRGLGEYATSTIVTASAITVGVVLLLRPLWLWLTEHLPQSLHTRLDRPGPRRRRRTGRPAPAPPAPPGRLLPRPARSSSSAGRAPAGSSAWPRSSRCRWSPTTASPFPDRDLLLFCAFLAVLVTLVGQGLTFAPLVRALGLRADEADQARLRNEARIAAVEAALQPARRAWRPSSTTTSTTARSARSARSCAPGWPATGTGWTCSTAPRPARSRCRRSTRRRCGCGGRSSRPSARSCCTGATSAGCPTRACATLERELDHEEGLLPTRSAR